MLRCIAKIYLQVSVLKSFKTFMFSYRKLFTCKQEDQTKPTRRKISGFFGHSSTKAAEGDACCKNSRNHRKYWFCNGDFLNRGGLWTWYPALPVYKRLGAALFTYRISNTAAAFSSFISLIPVFISASRMKETSRKNNVFAQFKKADRDRQKLIDTIIKQLRNLIAQHHAWKEPRDWPRARRLRSDRQTSSKHQFRPGSRASDRFIRSLLL